MATLTAYLIDGHQVDLRPSPPERQWMDLTDRKYAYRCLPMVIANSHGWSVHVLNGFSAIWHGGKDLSSVVVTSDTDAPPCGVSHFGHGILTFHIPVVFRTDPGFDILAQGQSNTPRDGLFPLTGVVEADWAPFTFTMNWIFTRPGHAVHFASGEPFCQIFPIRRADLLETAPELRLLSTNPDLDHEFRAWSQSRLGFNKDLKAQDPTAVAQQWQKHYHQGNTVTGSPPENAQHRTRLRPAPFVDKTGESS